MPTTLLSSQGWYHFGQELINSTYLQPYKKTSNGCERPKRVKLNPHNGYIERERHGAMHASRVAWSTLMLHRLCKQQYPKAVDNKIQALMHFTQLKEEELVYLIQYLGLGQHVAAEIVSSGKKESAAYMEQFLIKHGLNSQVASIFSCLITFQNQSEKLAKHLSQLKLAPEVIEGLQYVSLLITLADDFDNIRYNHSFKFTTIEKKLTQVFFYTKDKDTPVFFDYAQQLYQLIKEQKDLFLCKKLIGPNGKSFKDKTEEDYSVHKKIALEHADNVLAAMLDSFKKNAYFQKLLDTETPVSFKTFDKEPAFNPFIHGTNSTVLALMTHTEFQLMSVVDMVDSYGFAPLCGELTKGGLSFAKSNGNPCFARLNGEDNSNEYSLNKIINDYTPINKPLSKDLCKQELSRYVMNAPKSLFSSINLINIYLARVKQHGVENHGAQFAENTFPLAMDIFYLYLLFSTHIVAKDDNNINKLSYTEKNLLQDDIIKHLSLDQILIKLKKSNLSIKEIYHNPTAENCQKIIDLLTLPPECKIQQLFVYTNEALTKTKTSSQLKRETGYLYCNVSSWELGNMIYKTCKGSYKRDDFHIIAPELLRYMDALENRFQVLKKLIHEPSKPLQLSPEDLDLIDNPLPIIFCYNQARNMRIYTTNTQEYRAKKPFKLGEDIHIVATDTDANIKRLQAYSDRHRLNLTVISFADLECARNSLTTEHPLTVQEVIKRPGGYIDLKNLAKNEYSSPKTFLFYDVNKINNDDLKALNNFIIQQVNRLSYHPPSMTAIKSFRHQAIAILASNHTSEEKRAKLQACAHTVFQHRHAFRRLLADVILFISSLALVGLVVGITRMQQGHTFFFSSDKTQREREFTSVVKTMKLS